MDRIEGMFRTVYMPLREMAIVMHSVHVIIRACFQSTNIMITAHLYIQCKFTGGGVIVILTLVMHVTVTNKILSAVPLLV